jgi:hypothetical protein
MEIAQIIKEKRGTLLDVLMKNLQRSCCRIFKYPAAEIPHRIQEISRTQKQLLILFCALVTEADAQVFLTARS